MSGLALFHSVNVRWRGEASEGARAQQCDIAKLDCQSDERGFDVGALEGDALLDDGGCSFRTSGGHASKNQTMS